MQAYRNIKIELLFIFTACLAFTSYGQNTSKINQLKVALSQAQHPKDSAFQCNELAWEYRRVNLDTALIYAQKANEIATKNNLDHTDKDLIKEEGDSYMRMGLIHRMQGEYQLSDSTYNLAAQTRHELKDTLGEAGAYNALATLYVRQSKFEEAASYYKKSNEAVGDSGSEKALGVKSRALNGIGIMNENIGDLKEALINYEKSLAIKTELGDSAGMANTNLNIASVDIKMLNYEKASEILKEVVQYFEYHRDQNGMAKSYINLGAVNMYQDKYQEAIKYYNQASAVKERLGANDRATLLKNVGISHSKINQPDSAIVYLQNSYQQFEKLEKTLELVNIHYDLGNIYQYQLNDPQKALDNYKAALPLIDTAEVSIQNSNIYFGLSQAYQQLNQLEEAIYYANLNTSLKDSLQNTYFKAFNIREELAESRNEKQMLRKNLELKETQEWVKNLIIGLLAMAVAFLMVVGYNRRQMKKQQEAIEEVQTKLDNQENEFLSTILTVQGKERKRIAKELHDGVGAKLTVIKGYVDAIGKKMDLIQNDTTEQFIKASDLLASTCDEVRNVAKQMENNKNEFNLFIQVESLVKTFNEMNSFNTTLKNHDFANRRFDNQVESHLYKIIRELAVNALKYSKANELSIQLNHFNEESMINIMIEDDGIGFNEESLVSRQGMGLKNIKERVKDLGGEINIDSQIGRGTTIIIDVPIDINEEEDQLIS
ncbi:MAG: tetratricopeptide repeat protein [Bacteroidota bacterium]